MGEIFLGPNDKLLNIQMKGENSIPPFNSTPLLAKKDKQTLILPWKEAAASK